MKGVFPQPIKNTPKGYNNQNQIDGNVDEKVFCENKFNERHALIKAAKDNN